MHYHHNLAEAGDGAVSRDLGLALWNLGTEERRQPLIQAARPLLAGAVEAWPDDLDAWHALGRTHWFEGNGAEAQRAFQTVLTKAPRHEFALRDLAALLAQLGQRDQAIEHYGRLLAVDPWQSSYHFELAQLLGQAGDWPKARDECRAALRLNIANPECRKLLVTCLLRLGEQAEASAELRRLVAFEPANKEALERWFAAQQASPR
jgi:Flp pilus assembly protein TadD